MSGSWCESFLEIFMSIIAFKVLLNDPFLDNGPLDRLLSSFSFWIGVASLLIFNDNFSDEGDLHILFRDWNAMLSGSKGPAVPLNIFPRMKFEKLRSDFHCHLMLFISFNSSNTQFYESRIFCLFTFWVFFPDKSFKLISKYVHPKMLI